MATCWTSAGDAASDRPDLRSPLTLRERIEAASAAGFRGFGLLSDDLPAAVAEYRLTGIRDHARRQRNRPPRARGDPVLVGRRAAPRRSPTGSGTACSRRPRRSAPGTSRSPPTVTTARGTAGSGPRSSPSSPTQAAGRRRAAGDRVLPLVEHQDVARRPAARRRRRTRSRWRHHRHLAHRPRAHADRRPRVRAAGPHHRRRAERRRRAGGRDAVRGHGPSPPVLRRGRVRPAGHDHGPADRRVERARGASRSCPTSTDPCRSRRRSAGPPRVPAACWTAPGRTPTPSETNTTSACQRGTPPAHYETGVPPDASWLSAGAGPPATSREL